MRGYINKSIWPLALIIGATLAAAYFPSDNQELDALDEAEIDNFMGLMKEESVMINGAPIVCDREAYNCPSYRGKYKSKRLKNCKDVMTVWKTCTGDVHDLDRDGDGRPCERDCGH